MAAYRRYVIGRDGVAEKDIPVGGGKVDGGIVSERVFRVVSVEDAAELARISFETGKGVVKRLPMQRRVLACPARATAGEDDGELGGIAFLHPKGVGSAL